jgi:hypothetical protein
MKMEIVMFFRNVDEIKTVPRRIPADGILQRNRHKNIKFNSYLGDQIKVTRSDGESKWDTRIHTQFLSHQPLWRSRSRYDIKMDIKKITCKNVDST